MFLGLGFICVFVVYNRLFVWAIGPRAPFVWEAAGTLLEVVLIGVSISRI